MMNNYWQAFTVRFLGYFFIQIGIITVLLVVEPVLTEELKFRTDQLFNRRHSLPRIVTSSAINPDGSVPFPTPTIAQNSSNSFGNLVMGGSEIITPVDTNFGIVIEKINANARVIPNVDPGNEKEYSKALALGVAHAKGTSFPGQKGNIYLFSHSTDAPWNIVRYNAIFYLLSKLEPGDNVTMFYQGRRFDYVVFDKIVTSPDDIRYLTDSYDESVLTLQTCDPPGTLLRRLIVRAKLASS